MSKPLQISKQHLLVIESAGRRTAQLFEQKKKTEDKQYATAKKIKEKAENYLQDFGPDTVSVECRFTRRELRLMQKIFLGVTDRLRNRIIPSYKEKLDKTKDEKYTEYLLKSRGKEELLKNVLEVVEKGL